MNLNVDKIIDEAELGRFHYTLTFLGFLVTVLNGFAIVTLAIIVPVLSKEWGLPAAAFAPAHMSVMIGVLMGSFIGGMLSDRYGRKNTILWMTLLTVLAMGLTSFANSIETLIIYRFITGVGAGGAIPVSIALASEYIPARYRNLLLVLVFAGPPFGGFIGGNVGPDIVAAYGWQGLYYVGVLVAIPVIIIILLLLPISVKFYVHKGAHLERVKKILHRIQPTLQVEDNQQLVLNGPVGKKKSSVKELFSDGRKPLTILLWLLFFSTQFVMFFLNLWVPTILVQEGWSLENGGKALANFNLGSFFGGILIGRAADKIGSDRVLQTIFPIGTILLFGLSFCIAHPIWYFVVAFFAGGAILGANMSLGPYAASLYPVHIRGTGIGTALGVGRMGAITAAILGGSVLAWGIGGASYFHIALIPLILCTIYAYLLSYVKKRGKNNVL